MRYPYIDRKSLPCAHRWNMHHCKITQNAGLLSCKMPMQPYCFQSRARAVHSIFDRRADHATRTVKRYLSIRRRTRWWMPPEIAREVNVLWTTTARRGADRARVAGFSRLRRPLHRWEDRSPATLPALAGRMAATTADAISARDRSSFWAARRRTSPIVNSDCPQCELRSTILPTSENGT